MKDIKLQYIITMYNLNSYLSPRTLRFQSTNQLRRAKTFLSKSMKLVDEFGSIDLLHTKTWKSEVKMIHKISL